MDAFVLWLFDNIFGIEIEVLIIIICETTSNFEQQAFSFLISAWSANWEGSA